MITALPAVQWLHPRSRKYFDIYPSTAKRMANRRHRRALNQTTRMLELDPDAFDVETFDAPSLSTWDLW